MNFKIIFSEDNIRRFSSGGISYEEFVALMKEHYGGIGLWDSNSGIGYKDCDGDFVRVHSQMEWETMLSLFEKEKVIRLNVVSCLPVGGATPSPCGGVVSSPCGPIPSPCGTPSCDNGSLPSCADSVPPSCGGGLPFPFLFPSHQMNGGCGAAFSQFLPCFLKENLGNLSSFLPFGLPEGLPGRYMYHFLHREGIQALNRKDSETARTIFASLCELKPEDPTSHYNLACAESLLGNLEDSFGALVKSIELGYSDIDHLVSDPDLENLKVKSPSLFDEICGMLQQTQVNVQEGKGERKDEPEPKRKVVSEVPPVVVVTEPKKSAEQTKPEEISPVVIPPEIPPNPTESKWTKELSVLRELGFLSDSLLIDLLEQTSGSIQRTIELLL